MKWRRIKGTPYQVSDTGLIRNSSTNLMMKTKFNHDGYETICLVIDGKQRTCRVHRLVATAFVPNPLRKPEVHHMDGNKSNNHVSNLQWSDPYSNRWWSRNILKHSKMFSFKKIETLYNENKSLSLKAFINKLKQH